MNALPPIALTALLLVGCQRPPAPPMRSEAPAATLPAPATRLSLMEAKEAIQAEIHRATPGLSLDAGFSLEDRTTAEIWDRLQAQVFVVTGGVRQFQSYLVQERRVLPLGESFGGWGITSMCVADLDDDGRPELLFAYSFGSGIHRSQVGLWAGGPAADAGSVALRDEDLTLEKIDDQHVRTLYGSFDPASGEVIRRGEFGMVRLLSAGPVPRLEIDLAPSLPAAVAARVWKK